MGALVFWLGVGLLVALVLVAARAVDRRDRRRGHSLRSSGEMARDAWEHRRDAVAGDSIGHLNADRSWTAHSRQVEGRSTPPDERPEAEAAGGPPSGRPVGPGSRARDDPRWPCWPLGWWPCCCWSSRRWRGGVGLVRAGERTWQGASGLGDLRANRPARASDRFRIGSVTKSFVATLVLQLVGEGRLRLDDKLERWLPGLVPNGERITVRQLLNHTSGLYNYSDDLPEPPRRFRPRELVAIATGHKPLFTPGREFSYSNTNYILAGLVVERVTGRPLADQLEQRILGPLGLDDTELPTTERRITGGHVHGYAPPDEDWQVTDGPARLVDVTQMDTSWGWAAGAMVSTTADLARFYQALLSGQLLPRSS